MDAVQRLNVGGQKCKLMPKIESVHVETRLTRGISIGYHPYWKESWLGFLAANARNRIKRWRTATKLLTVW